MTTPSIRKIHLDNASASETDNQALNLFCEASRTFFANQEGAGLLSKDSADAVAAASKKLALALTHTSDTNAFWCNTGTDALASSIDASSNFRLGSIVSSDVEHAALTSAIDRLAAKGSCEVKRAKIGIDGMIDLKHLESLLDDKTSLLAIHHVQAETGAIQNLEAIRGILDAKAPRALFLADSTQSALKLELPWKSAKLDFATISGAKVGAPGGAALLYRDDPRKILGKRVSALRSIEHKVGRCQPAACVALAELATELAASLSKRLEKTTILKSEFAAAIKKELGGKVRFTMKDSLSSPYILHLLIPGIQGATIVRMMASLGYGISAGSACEAEAKSPSKTLLAMGIPRTEAYSALRISFWKGVDVSEAASFASALASCVKEY